MVTGSDAMFMFVGDICAPGGPGMATSGRAPGRHDQHAHVSAARGLRVLSIDGIHIKPPISPSSLWLRLEWTIEVRVCDTSSILSLSLSLPLSLSFGFVYQHLDGFVGEYTRP